MGVGVGGWGKWGTWLKAAANREASVAKQLANQTRMMRRGSAWTRRSLLVTQRFPEAPPFLPTSSDTLHDCNTHHSTPHASRITHHSTTHAPTARNGKRLLCASAVDISSLSRISVFLAEASRRDEARPGPWRNAAEEKHHQWSLSSASVPFSTAHARLSL
jgi:hypothetical protein